jgi:hypothetical protein
LEVELTASGKAEVGLGIKPAARYLTAASLKQMAKEPIWGFVCAGINKKRRSKKRHKIVFPDLFYSLFLFLKS